MTATPDTRFAAAPAAKTQPRDALAMLTPFGWNGGLAVIFALLAASFFLAGYFVIYWRNADMDLVVIYNALVMNDGGPQVYHDHPAYLTIVSLKLWYQLLHHLGLLNAWKLSSLPPASNIPAFDAAMTEAVRAGRVLAGLISALFVAAFAGLIRPIVRDWRIALLATFAFAFSGGVAVHMRILRTEMIAACFVIFAFMILIVVAQRASTWRPLALLAAAALCVLGMENKVQVILLIAALPVIILPFGADSGASTGFWDNGSRSWLTALFAAVIATVLFSAALPLIRAGLDPDAIATAKLRPLIAGTFGLYQIALAAWIGIGMTVFAVTWRVRLTETLTTISAVIAGAALGLLALNLDTNVQNAVAVINPIEKMLVFIDLASAQDIARDGNIVGVGLLLKGIAGVLQRYTFVLFTSPRPAVFLTWLIIPGIVYAWRRGEKQVALQAALLLLTAIGIDALGIRRGLKAEYFILTDPLIIIAGAVLLDRMSDLRFRKWAYPIGAALLVLHVAVSQAEPVKSVLKREGPEGYCQWRPYYMPLMPLPHCNTPAKPA
ncbi:MAG: hypothetical protein ACRC9K_08000 [Afipia sp.]